jgi:Fic family protein
MDRSAYLMEPLLPTGMPDLDESALALLSRSAALGGQLHPTTRGTVASFLRIINCHYSNLIEGHGTRPVDIERAMRHDYAAEPAKRDLQQESLAHIECQRLIEERIAGEPDIAIADAGFLRWLHREFYNRLPGTMRTVKNDATGETAEVVPGKFRQRDVQVGRHVGPTAAALPGLVDRFSAFYRMESFRGIEPIVAVAAAHHRLMWIHPFLDGNGRVARLFTDAWFRRMPLPGYGLWNVSRGLARRRNDYMSALTWGDSPRRNDLDGRGNLSNEGLARFCRFFIEVCLDQADFMAKQLDLPGLVERVEGYVALRSTRTIPPPERDGEPLRIEASRMIRETVLRGEAGRGDLVRGSGLAERTGRKLLGQLLKERLLVSDTPKGPVRFGLPAHVADYIIPGLSSG